MNRPGRALLAALLILSALALGACGGGGGDGNAQRLLDRAFARPLDSADLTLDAQVDVKGSKALTRPIRIHASGPFRGNRKRLPSVNLDLKIDAGGPNQTVQTGFLSTGDRVFVKFQDVFYEQPAGQVAQANRAIARNQGRKSSLRALGLDPRSWLEDAEEKGDATIAGVKTRRVSGKLDVRAVVRDFNDFVKRSGGAIGSATGQVPPRPLSDDEVNKIQDVVEDPTFEVYIGKNDDVIRRVAGHVKLSVPEEDRDQVGGISGGTLSFSVQFTNVNGNQSIEAPKNARPISDLVRSLGAGTLGNLGGSGSAGGGGGTGSGGGAQAPSPSSAPNAESFKKYAQCLDKAPPQDTDALQRCAELLQ